MGRGPSIPGFMRFSVIICTRNRPHQLQRALRSIGQCVQPVDDRGWEVLVVDNGCAGLLEGIAHEFEPVLPLRVVREERVGLSNARNRGTLAAKGEWLLWTDDDVTVASHWLAEYCAAIGHFPNADVFGGPIRLHFEGKPPDWLVEGQNDVRSAYANRERHDVTQTFGGDGPLPYGANFAVRRSAALEFPFDPRLGHQPDHPTRGWEETFVIRKILRDRSTGHWLPDAEVTHHIDAARQTSEYLRSYYFDTGFIHTFAETQQMKRTRVADRLMRALFKAVRHEFAHAAQTLTGSRANRADHLRQAALNWGRAKAGLNMLVRADHVPWSESGP